MYLLAKASLIEFLICKADTQNQQQINCFTALNITVYFFIQRQKSKPTKYIVFREKQLIIYN